MSPADLLRADLRLITELVPVGSRVLDLGCSDGSLMVHLRDERGCMVRGIELDHADLAAAISRGLSVVEADLDDGLEGYPDGSFDVVVLSQTLQVVRTPAFVLREMLRVGRHAVVSYPNFGYWKVRGYLATKGRMPVSRSIPYSWYHTPNIHHTTIKDFRDFVDANGGEIERSFALITEAWHRSQVRHVNFWPNLLADTAVAMVRPKR
ncbi:MAG TPA: methionine biosynthesis protein MetW [Coriobacteriia bacterium]|nr:methionine biosynthesis protein MetW [Coriobacteriia bacterium]